ncbi:MAG: SUMF1/EgtB/PvdO family nonheme iron enzyme [Verrucomicrobia bacterium]|nr:SUMF1/EgtB/PvdO family nonheme iron enzyme [Verrucomicrobiota bacterium]
MKTLVQFAALLLVVVCLLAAGCGQPESKVPATPENAVEARNQMRAVRSQIKSSGASYLQEMLRRGDGLEKSGGEALEAKNYAKALASFAEARKCYQQAIGIEAGMEAKREAAIAAQNAAEAARVAASAATKADARPAAFVAAVDTAKEAEDALAREEFEKAKKLYTRVAEGFKAAQADAEKAARAEMSNAAQAAKKDAEAARAAASAASKPDARPESFGAAANAEKEAGEALAKEDFAKAKELFARAAEGFKAAQSDGEKANRAELSRAAYAKKKEAEEERLTANVAFKTDARPESYVTAGNCMKEGEEALAKEDFAKAKELFTRAFENYKTAQADAGKIIRAEAARAAWIKQLAEADAALMERQAAADFAKVKAQAESAAALAAKDPGQAAQQFTAATAALKELFAQARTKENLPKAVPFLARMENALRTGDWLQTHRTLGELEQLVPGEPRMADFRAKAAALPWPKELPVDLGGGATINFVLIQPGTFAMGEGNEKHDVTLTKPFYIGKFEVTQQQWQAVMGSNPSSWRGNKNPLENISWEACQGFLVKVNEKLPGLKAALPTEAQWEYACRAGTTTKFSFGDNPDVLKEYAVYPFVRGWRNFETSPVGTKKPNPWGLYDMHGNVAEFCSDRFGPYPTSAQVDPQGADSGSDRVLRGGSCRDGPPFLTSRVRKDVMSGNVLSNAGLRLVLVTEAIAAYHASLVKVTDTPPASAASTTSAPPPPPANTPTATPTPPSAPAMTTSAPAGPDDWMRGLPPRASASYVQVRDGAKGGKGLMGLRSWRAMWGNKLRDPTRGFVELEFAELLLSDSSKSENTKENPKVEEDRKKNNLKEAAFVVQSVRARNVTDSALLNRLDEVAKKLP